MARHKKTYKRLLGKVKPRAESKTRPGKIKGTRFILEEKIGAGGLCEVYSALDLLRVECGDAITKVAIKRLQPEFAENPAAQRLLAREFCALRHLPHSGVVRVFDLYRENWGLALSMELLEGRDLNEEISEGGVGLGKEALPIISSLFETLVFLHGHNIMHGDIKPANIMRSAERPCVLLDFNTAELASTPGKASSAIGQALCQEIRIQAFSSLHASPERLQGAAPSTADDVFSACCTAYELITGTHPFKRLTATEAQDRRMKPEKNSALEGLYWNALTQGLSFEVSGRPDAAWLLNALRRRGILHKLLFSSS